jgi:hypothetical protein
VEPTGRLPEPLPPGWRVAHLNDLRAALRERHHAQALALEHQSAIVLLNRLRAALPLSVRHHRLAGKGAIVVLTEVAAEAGPADAAVALAGGELAWRLLLAVSRSSDGSG